MKAKVIIDMPQTCYDCPFAMRQYETFLVSQKRIKNSCACVLTHKTITSTRRNRYCPLKEMPIIEEIPISWIERFITEGVYGAGRIERDSIRFMVEMWRKEQKGEDK